MNRTQLSKTPLALMLSSLAAACGGSEAAESDWRKAPLGLELIDSQFVDMVPKDNELTDAKVALGRQLFFDKRLSKDGSMSCETCHQHALGWSNGERFSTKVGGGVNTRNSPALYNLAYHPELYWDGRAKSLEENITAAWKSQMNAGEDPAPIAATIGAIDGYQSQFAAVFGGAASPTNIAQALAAFVRTLRSGGSAWDRYEKTNDGSVVSQDAIDGHALFTQKAGCIVCHTLPLYTDMRFHAVGVGEAADVGRGKIESANPNAQGAFKTPSLRSVAKSGPYFHDGSVADLRAAVATMTRGGGDAKHFPQKDPLLQDKHLSDAEIDKIVAFLQALTSEESYSAPTLPQ